MLGFEETLYGEGRDGRYWYLVGETGRARLGLWTEQVGLAGGRGGAHVHYAFHVADEVIDRLRGRIEEAGAEVEGPVQLGPGRAIYVTDPDERRRVLEPGHGGLRPWRPLRRRSGDLQAARRLARQSRQDVVEQGGAIGSAEFRREFCLDLGAILAIHRELHRDESLRGVVAIALDEVRSTVGCSGAGGVTGASGAPGDSAGRSRLRFRDRLRFRLRLGFRLRLRRLSEVGSFQKVAASTAAASSAEFVEGAAGSVDLPAGIGFGPLADAQRVHVGLLADPCRLGLSLANDLLGPSLGAGDDDERAASASVASSSRSMSGHAKGNGQMRSAPPRHRIRAMPNRKVLAVLGAAQFLMVLDQAVMNVAISQLVADFDAITIQAVIALYALTMAALMLTGGKVGDIIGRRRAFIIGICIYAQPGQR